MLREWGSGKSCFGEKIWPFGFLVDFQSGCECELESEFGVNFGECELENELGAPFGVRGLGLNFWRFLNAPRVGEWEKLFWRKNMAIWIFGRFSKWARM